MTEQDASDPDEQADDARAVDETVGTTDESATDETDAGAASGTDGTEPSGDGEYPLSDVEVDEEFEPDFEGDVDGDLVARVEETDPESVARELGALRARVDALEDQLAAREEELDEVNSKLKRKQADFQNFKKRMEKRREQERKRATEDLVERLLDVRDNLVRALEQDEDADIRSGVETTLRGFDDALAAENVEVVEPESGTEVDAHRHEVLARVDAEAPADTIADVHRPGYVMAEKVLRPAQVTVSDGPGDGTESGTDDADSAASE